MNPTAETRPISLLRLPEVLQRRGRKKSQHAADVARGLFVRPLKPGSRLALYDSRSVDVLVAADLAGKSPEEIRALVRKLEQERAQVLSALIAT